MGDHFTAEERLDAWLFDVEEGDYAKHRADALRYAAEVMRQEVPGGDYKRNVYEVAASWLERRAEREEGESDG